MRPFCIEPSRTFLRADLSLASSQSVLVRHASLHRRRSSKQSLTMSLVQCGLRSRARRSSTLPARSLSSTPTSTGLVRACLSRNHPRRLELTMSIVPRVRGRASRRGRPRRARAHEPLDAAARRTGRPPPSRVGSTCASLSSCALELLAADEEPAQVAEMNRERAFLLELVRLDS